MDGWVGGWMDERGFDGGRDKRAHTRVVWMDGWMDEEVGGWVRGG